MKNLKRKKATKRYRSARTGEFVSKEEADENKDTTVSETIETDEVEGDVVAAPDDEADVC